MTILFFSYSHVDEPLRDSLEKHLSALVRQGFIETWHDRRIGAGDELNAEISDNLEHANIILLLVSSDFLASDYCYGVELRRAMERHEAGEARVIPIILRPCDWRDTPFGKLLALPIDGKPVRSWPDIDEAFVNIVNGIKAALPKPPLESRNEAPAAESTAQMSARPRSSNMRLRKTFSQADKDTFLDSTFTYIKHFFETSLIELQKRNSDITTRFRVLDNNRFTATIYRNGESVARCKIVLGGGFRNGISYSSNDQANENSFNENIDVANDDQNMFLQPIIQQRGSSVHLSQEGAAEFYWAMLIKTLQ